MDVRTLRFLLNLLKFRSWTIPVVIGLSLVASLAEGLSVGLLIPFLHELLGSASPAENRHGAIVEWLNAYAGLFPEDIRLAVLAASIIGLAVIRAGIGFADGVASSWVSGMINHRLRTELIQHILLVDYEYLCNTDSGKLINTIEGETARTTAALGVLFSITTSATMVFVFTVLLLLISWQLTLTVIAGVAAISVLIRGLAQRASSISTMTVIANQLLSERTWEIFDGMRIIRAFGQEPREEARFLDASESVRRAELRLDLVSGLTQPVLEILYAPLFIGVLLLASGTGIGVPATLAFLLLLYRAQPHARRLNHARVHLASLSGGVRDVMGLLNARDKPYIRSGQRRFERLTSGVEFRNVSFSYRAGPDMRPALEGVSLTIVEGEVTAIVGGSGAGKSTLINLLFRFYDPARGTIFIDDIPLQHYDLASWRSALAISGQDAELMSGTIAENISYGVPNADRQSIIRAAKQASAYTFIDGLPQGFDTLVGQRGLLLSAGQRQRIALARALLCNPQVLVLDEATNALDSITEAEIHQAFEALRGSCTLLVIAHRLGTIRNADHVIVLDQGRVAETGRPSDLLRHQGLLSQMYDLQLLDSSMK